MSQPWEASQIKQPPWVLENRQARVAVVGLASRANVSEEMARLARLLSKTSCPRCLSLEHEPRLGEMDFDFAIVVGGDGSILRTARLLGEHQIPLLGINLGRLGFLASLQPEEVDASLPLLATGSCHEVSHLMLRCQLYLKDELLLSDLAINEVAVRSGPPYTLLELDLFVDGEWVTTYSSDGLIISTPVGSTAHSLSAGGPILRKELDAVVITPISPHTLTNRPVVDAAHRTYVLTHKPRGCRSAAVVVDGREVGLLEPEQSLVVSAAPQRFLLLEVPNHPYYRTLRDKLRWGGGVRPS